MKFSVVICDAPWQFSDPLKNMRAKTLRSASSNYKTMSLLELERLAPLIDDVTEDSCILALWCPSSMLEDGIRLVRNWGFKLKQTAVWVKLSKRSGLHDNIRLSLGMGRLFRNSHELVLICSKGKLHKNLKNRSQYSVFLARTQKHSQKPTELHESLELMFPNSNKLELFARTNRTGWECIGDELTNNDIADDLKILAVK